MKNTYAYGEGSMGWEPEPKYTHLQVVRNEVTKALHGEAADLALVAQFLDEIAVHGYAAPATTGDPAVELEIRQNELSIVQMGVNATPCRCMRFTPARAAAAVPNEAEQT